MSEVSWEADLAEYLNELSATQDLLLDALRRKLKLLAAADQAGLIAIGVLFHAGGGLAISALFIAAILGLSVLSRALRADELRTIGFNFKNDESKLLWDTLRLADFPVLVPHRPGREPREKKETQIRAEHNLENDIEVVFLEIELDDPSDFFQRLDIEVLDEDKRFIIRVTGCASAQNRNTNTPNPTPIATAMKLVWIRSSTGCARAAVAGVSTSAA